MGTEGGRVSPIQEVHRGLKKGTQRHYFERASDDAYN